MALGSDIKKVLVDDISYFKNLQKNTSESFVPRWGMPTTFSEIEKAMKDPTTSSDEKILMSTWITEFSLIEKRLDDTSATIRLAALRNELSGVNQASPPPGIGYTVVGAITPPVQMDARGVLAYKKILESDLRLALRSEMETFEGKLEKMTPENLEGMLRTTDFLLNFSWLEKIPGMKDRAQEITHYMPLIQGLAGAIMIQKLQKLGYAVYLNGKDQIKVVSDKPDARDVELKINAHLTRSPILSQSLQAGLLYSSASFHTYRASVTDADGNIIDPTKTTIKQYGEYLNKKAKNTLDSSEKSFLYSEKFFDPKLPFQAVLYQSKDYAKIVGLMEGITGDPAVRDLLPRGTTQESAKNNSETTSDPNSVAGMAGKGIGQVGGIIGKLVGAGASGGARVLGEVFSEATKHGGAWGSLAVIGGLIFSIWKGGFWKTLGGLFGLGLADAASRGELKGLTGESVPRKPQSGETPPAAVAAGNSPRKPQSGETPPAAAAAGSNQGNPLKEPEKAKDPAGKLTQRFLIAQAMGCENIYEDDIDAEKSILDIMKSANYEKLRIALDKDDATSWQGVLDSMKYTSLSESDQQKIADTIKKDNTDARTTLSKMMGHLDKNSYVQALPPDERTSKNLDQMMDHVVTMHNKTLAPAQKPATAGNVIPPPAIAASADGHSNLYMLSRLLTQGYIPQLSDNTWSSAKDQAFYKRFWSGMTYFIWDGGPLTNNKDSKNPLVGAWHKGLDEKVAAFTLVQVADEKQMTESALATLRTRAGNIDSKALLESELLDRKTKVDAIEEALKKQPFDLKNLQTALSNYEKSVKTPWEIIGNKLGMKWGVNGWKVFKSVDANVYENKAHNIVVANQTTPEAIKVEAEQLGAVLDESKQKVLDTFTAWEADPKNTEKKQAALGALEKYNKLVLETNGKVSEKFALLTESEAQSIGKNTKSGSWLSEFIHANTTGKNFGWVDTIDKWTSETSGIKGARRGFVGVGLLTIAYGTGTGFSDLVKDGKIGTAMTSLLDLGIGMVPFVGSIHDTAILSFEEYERFMLGRKLSYEEREMRKWMIVLGVIPGVGMAIKGGGKAIGSGLALSAGSTIFKGGNLMRSTAMYSLLGLSIASATYDIHTKVPDITNAVVDATKDTRTMIKAKLS